MKQNIGIELRILQMAIVYSSPMIIGSNLIQAFSRTGWANLSGIAEGEQDNNPIIIRYIEQLLDLTLHEVPDPTGTHPERPSGKNHVLNSDTRIHRRPLPAIIRTHITAGHDSDGCFLEERVVLPMG